MAALEKIEKLPSPLSNLIKESSNIRDSKVHLRALNYYLNLRYKNDIDVVRKTIPQKLFTFNEVINRIGDVDKSTDLETRLALASLFDHKKHYSMCIFNAYYLALIKGQTIDPQYYMSAENSCVKDIADFYTFLLTGQIPEKRTLNVDVLSFFSNELLMPQPNSPSFAKPEGEPAARKLMLREMDHPMQIVLFGGKLLRDELSEKIDFIVNPLSGALEIGYALKAIYNLIDEDKIDKILLVKYSRYGEGDVVQKNIEKYIPAYKKDELKELFGKRVLIIDDNTFSGNTLFELRQMLYSYTDRIGISAVERRTDMKEKRCVELEDLEIKPISKLRYIERVIEYVVRNNINLT